MIKIEVVKQKDIRDILKLEQELNMSLIKKEYGSHAIFRNAGSIRGRFYRRSKELNNYERAFLWCLIDYCSEKRMRKTSIKKLKPIFLEFSKRYFLTRPNFQKITRNLLKKGFIDIKRNYIYLDIPDRELLSVEDRISKDLLLNYVSQKQKLEKPSLKSIYLIAKNKRYSLGYLRGYITKFSAHATGEIDELSITSSTQGKGVGSMLVNKFLNICRQNDVSFVLVSTPKENKGAIQFYKKCGFRRETKVYLCWKQNN